MNLILLEPITHLGELGDEVGVKAGYGRNFLIPQGKAVRATPENRTLFEERRAELERASLARLSDAEQRAEGLRGLSVTISAKVGEEGKLYGSVGTRDVAEALMAVGAVVEKGEVKMPEGALRHVGEFEIDIQLHTDLTVAVTVAVVGDQ
ncbi:MAG: 50S ribosomal protein L9 [Pseudomonadales bacterium]